MLYVDRANGQFRKQLASIIAVIDVINVDMKI